MLSIFAELYVTMIMIIKIIRIIVNRVDLAETSGRAAEGGTEGQEAGSVKRRAGSRPSLDRVPASISHPWSG